MKQLNWTLAGVALVMLLLIPGLATGQSPEGQRIEPSQLKTVFENLGYEVKFLNSEAGKEKIQITTTKDDLTIPVAAEVSASRNYVWLTVLLVSKIPEGEKATNLLKENAAIQPAHFYVTPSGRLMLGLAVENRSPAPPWIRASLDKLLRDVVQTRRLWE